MLSPLFVPYYLGRRFSLKFLVGCQLALLAALWFAAPLTTGIPSPLEIASEWQRLATTKGLLVELGHSTTTISQALLLSTCISLLLASLATADGFKATAGFVSSLRFLGFAGLTYLFTLWTNDQTQLKLSLLTFGMTVFMVRSMMDVVNSVPQTEVDYARTLGLKGWRLTWELIVLGRRHDMLDLVRQNAAMGWTLVAMVEGLTRSDGGIGAMLLNANKAFSLPGVFAIQLTILAYGLLQDVSLVWLRRLLCPYAELNRSNK